MNLSLFPALDSPYSKTENPKALIQSIISLHVQICLASSNLMYSERHKGHFFFRNEAIPLPRPATILAWKAICQVGNSKSPFCLLPFLPSLRAEDEVGDAIQMLGAKVPSLSRKSALHIRDKEKGIVWGPAYVAFDGKIVNQYSKSNLLESQFLIPFEHLNPESKLTSIRHRMEFLAAHGIPVTSAVANACKLPEITRLLFQFTSQVAAEKWAAAYAQADSILLADSKQARADYLLMLDIAIESRKEKNKDESNKKTQIGKNSKLQDKFGDLTKIDFNF